MRGQHEPFPFGVVCHRPPELGCRRRPIECDLRALFQQSKQLFVECVDTLSEFGQGNG